MVRVYDAAGRAIVTVFEGLATGQEQTITWRACGLASGVYFLKVTSGGESRTGKVVLLK